MRNTLIKKRKDILKKLGGLPEPRVVNKEWLYILGEEMRHSIMIEGVFIDEQELEEVLMQGKAETRSTMEALNYFKTAKFIYGLGYENYKTGEFMMSISLIRQINKGLFEGIKEGLADFRKGEIRIAGAKIVPPSSFFLKEWMDFYVKYVVENFTEANLIELAAKQHVLFETIHPFEDGNGRTGRILLNYILISGGYPPAILKGDEKSKSRYYRALEQGEKVLVPFLTEEVRPQALKSAMEEMKVKDLVELLTDSLRENFDRLICSLFEEKGKHLMDAEEVAEKMGYSKDSMRTLIKRGKFIGVKKGKKWFTHPELYLG